MRLIYMFLFVSLISPFASMAQIGDDPSNGNLFAEPELNDYVMAQRSPGFSPITEVVDAEGTAL